MEDLNLLRALERLLSTASVTVAARQLGVGQPAASRSLERLREQLGDPLLVRAGKGMVLTERGRALLPEVQTALAAAERALQPLAPFDAATATGVFRLAMGDDAQTALTARIVQRLRQTAPGMDLRIRPVTLGLGAELERDALDLVVFPDIRALPGFKVPDLSAFVLRDLFTERFCVVSQGPRRWTLDDYCDAGHVLVSGGGDNDRGFVDLILQGLGRKRRVVLTVPTFHQAAMVVATSDLVATLPLHAARAAKMGLHLGDPPLELPELPMRLLWHPRTTASSRHRFLRQLIADCAAGLDADRS